MELNPVDEFILGDLHRWLLAHPKVDFGLFVGMFITCLVAGVFLIVRSYTK